MNSDAAPTPSAQRPRVGMVRGGQLARMTSQAAERLDLDFLVLDQDPNCPAGQVGAVIVPGEPTDLDDLLRFAQQVDVVCFDDESVPLAHMAELEAAGHLLAPSSNAAELGFDKVRSRQRLLASGLPTPEWTHATSVDEIVAFGDRVGWPVVTKAPRNGYDGRGVLVVADRAAAPTAIDQFGPDVLVEQAVPFDLEVAVTVARNRAGDVVAFPPVHTHQQDGICVRVTYPAQIDAAVAAEAVRIARAAADWADLLGLMTVELFVVGDRVLINEFALRPHNSAHLTIDAFDHSQFDLLLRSLGGLEFPEPHPVVDHAEMLNILGAESGDPQLPVDPSPTVRVHWYGKEPRPGRKVGHVTVLGATINPEGVQS